MNQWKIYSDREDAMAAEISSKIDQMHDFDCAHVHSLIEYASAPLETKRLQKMPLPQRAGDCSQTIAYFIISTRP